MQTKMRLVLFGGTIAFPLILLIGMDYMDRSTVETVLGVWVAAGLILLAPGAYLTTNFVAGRAIRRLNAACSEMRNGNLSPFESVPEDWENPDELQLLKANMFWMSHAVESRQIALNSALKDLAGAQQRVMESLDYASLIQKAFLPPPEELKGVFPDHFLIWEQRDVVGGDSYWMRKTSAGVFVAVIDCTGHGVPGAFMTLIVHSLFERLDVESMEGDPASVLACMNRGVKSALGSDDGSSGADDGMDCSVCYIPDDRQQVVFSGARNSLFIRHADSAVTEVKGDRCGVGFARSPADYGFTNKVVTVRPGMRFYLMSDGVVDQVGGETRLPYGKKRLRNFLSGNGREDFSRQQVLLEHELTRYRGGESVRDDRTVLGFALTDRREHAAEV
ncbi:MAG: PP2C family protein-serine/threonine phosphatase [Desulfovibrio sp.]|uniref:PP2C family protein-serine/threonine phosphatase n=1 Tax=Desulfovibrio sp. 7SRBS1 TaxID=3378064 RepID=UPI003B3E8669